jgi:ketosteroid isomerase-like protein
MPWKRAMSQANLEWLRTLYDRYAVGETDPLFERLADDIEWVSSVSGSPALGTFSGRFHGPEGVRCYFQGLAQDWRITKHEMQEMVADGDCIAVRNSVEAVNKHTGKKAEVTTRHRLVLRDGKIQRFEEHCDDITPLEAACRANGP